MPIMTDQQQHHPISPPRELVLQWASESLATQDLCNRAAQWGYDQRGEVNEAELQKARDQELEACCKWLQCEAGDSATEFVAGDLRSARRPKPPSLKEQALEDLDQIDGHAVDQLSAYVIHDDLKQRVSNIRRALEALPND